MRDTGIIAPGFFFFTPHKEASHGQATYSWNVFGPMILIGIGLVALIKAFYLREG